MFDKQGLVNKNCSVRDYRCKPLASSNNNRSLKKKQKKTSHFTK